MPNDFFEVTHITEYVNNRPKSNALGILLRPASETDFETTKLDEIIIDCVFIKRAELDNLFQDDTQNNVRQAIKQLEKSSQQQTEHDEPTHHKTVGSMTALIATLLKMAEYNKEDLKEPYGDLNAIIQGKADGLGLSIGKDFIAKWIKKADEIL